MKRYMVQFRVQRDKTWDEGLSFDELEQAKAHLQAVLNTTSPGDLLGRIYDRTEDKIVFETGPTTA